MRLQLLAPCAALALLFWVGCVAACAPRPGRAPAPAPERRVAPAQPGPERRPARAAAGPVLSTRFGKLPIFPPDNPWNRDISGARVHPRSADYVASIGADRPLHPDFGTTWQGAPNGIPFVVVGAGQAKVPVRFRYAAESDPGPYPIPANAPIEGGPKGTGDRHVLVVDYAGRRLYELYRAFPAAGGGWRAVSGAIFDLTSNRLRPAGWTSADAAGLPIFPGLVRYDEAVGRGEIRHALRFTAARTQRAYMTPARHYASARRDPRLPPMGLRLRLRADFDLSGFPRVAQVILRALQRYGMILADNGADWFLSGAPHPRWDDDALRALKRVRGRDFEAVYTGPIVR